jgi:chemotaxis protein histidine kinase CheA/CheY-like chemotaxis protein
MTSQENMSPDGPENSEDDVPMHELSGRFTQLAEFAAETKHDQLLRAACTIADLLSIAVLYSEDSASAHRTAEIVEFCREQALPILTDSESNDQIEPLLQLVDDGWADSLQMLSPEERFTPAAAGDWSDSASTQWSDSSLSAAELDAEDCDIPASEPLDLDGILASLAEAASESNEAAPATQSATVFDGTASTIPRPPTKPESIDDPEMVGAYADDAQQCLAEMESCLLSLGTRSTDAEAQRNFCRQLHTLKGASGTVGLARLASYLHDVESWIEGASGAAVSVDSLLECVDAVRAQLASPGNSDFGASGGDTSPPPPASNVPVAAAQTPIPAPTPVLAARLDGDVFVRVEASRLERLMDLLAELVMLRNRRETHVTSVRALHDEFNLCAARTRSLTTMIDIPNPTAGNDGETPHDSLQTHMAHRRFLSRSLDEIAGDTVELSRSLQEVFDPLADDNSAVSHLIGRFRQELMELRRQPVSGLFQRLQRSIRDAARAENKTVDIRLEGQGARAERAVQERLFEPLLHLVRNAVSHGLQTEEERRREGKSGIGKITLSAWSDAATLCVEVKDDGRGLNDETLEYRGRALGLLPAGEVASQAQIRQLIFHPGFSTKATVSEISGRGVGMDVVDTWVRRLRGRIDVESTIGEGTTFRLQIPLRSAVEHAMIVRAGRQLFALPMHTVSRTSDARLSMGNMREAPVDDQVQRLSHILNLDNGQVARSLVTLRGTAGPLTALQNKHTAMTIAVDAIVGVEEVVVRALPPLLQRNELFAGVTLSGRAEMVLLLDAERLIELANQGDGSDESVEQATAGTAGEGAARMMPPESDSHHEQEQRECILIVDDSVVVRRSLSRKLNAAGYATREAGNGNAALKVLRTHDVAAVVTDVDMPEMSGIELLQEMKHQKQFRDIPVTVLSSRDSEAMPHEIPELQPANVLAKPVTDETITAIVEMLSAAEALSS